jgi:GTP1/Obg family GTP-binding protein
VRFNHSLNACQWMAVMMRKVMNGYAARVRTSAAAVTGSRAQAQGRSEHLHRALEILHIHEQPLLPAG